jgi:hypothetical protein
MSRIRIVGGDIIETTGGNHKVYSKENIENSSDSQMNQVGKSSGLIYGDNQKAPDIKSQFLQTKIPEYVVLFKRLPSYQGEFGWDYMRDEYLTGTCIEGLEDLKKIYVPFEAQTKNINTSSPYGTYYTPWLSMFVNHNSVIGKEVELMIEVPTDFISYDVDFSTEEMIFVPSSKNLRVVPDKIPITDGISSVKIKIFCDATLDTDATIDVKSSKGDIVGKMNVMKNKGVDKLTINVYVIKAFVTDDPVFSKAVVDTEINKLGGLSKIEEYLNKQSLNQALIQIKLIYDTQYDWENKKSTLLLVNQGKNVAGEIKQELSKYIGMIKDTQKMLMHEGKYMDYINERFKMLNSKYYSQKGIFLFLTPFNSPSAGGASYTAPVDSKRIILYKTNLDDFPTYAHEIGHTLGLEHTFLSKDTACNTIAVQTEINNTKQDLQRKKEEKRTYFQTNNAYFVLHPNEKAKYEAPFNENIKNLEDTLIVLEKNKIRFTKAKTDNIMDYESEQNCAAPPVVLYNNPLKPLSFNKGQWIVMEDETKTIYH